MDTSPTLHSKSTSYPSPHFHSSRRSITSPNANYLLPSPPKEPAHLNTAQPLNIAPSLIKSTILTTAAAAVTIAPQTLVSKPTRELAAIPPPPLLSSSSVLYSHLDPDPARETTSSALSSSSNPALLSITHRQKASQQYRPHQQNQQTSDIALAHPLATPLPDHPHPEYFLPSTFVSLNAGTFNVSSQSTGAHLAQTPSALAAEIRSFASSSPSYFPSLSPVSSSSSEAPSENQQTPSGNRRTFSTVNMPPTTHCRQGSTNLGSGHQWEPYPSLKVTAPSERRGHKPCHSLSTQFSPSALSSLKLPPISAPTLLPSATLPDTPAVAALDLKELSCNTVSELLDQAQSNHGDKFAILLLDMRPAVCNAVSSIDSAVSVSVPNMLLKRPMYSLEMVTEQLTTEREVDAFSNWRRFSNIVFFDATGTVPSKGSPIFCIAQKFRKEGCGYNAFASEHGSQCSADSSSTTMSTANHANNNLHPPVSASIATTSKSPVPATSPARCRLHLGSLPAMITKPSAGDTVACETPMMENPNVNPLFESVRQAMGLNTNITEEVAVRLPTGFSVDSIRSQLPQWLLNSLCEGTGKKNLAQDFQKVEIAEKKRLALLMCPQEMRSGRTTNFSIGAGIEKGLKNRYNNVWPFDHTRVKIQETEDGLDDYINASFLRPPFGEKSYIATQGPLPSTFLDFWKIVWEQNSRVIVMLTREMEMGRIKCHQYWPSAQQPSMDLGPIRLTFLGEELPDMADDAVLVRQLRLQHLGHPREAERVITQIQYTGWPDFGVPDTPVEVLKVVKLANEHNQVLSSATAAPSSSSATSTPSAMAGPMVVHCSAGCGRTGAFCVIDAVLSNLSGSNHGGYPSAVGPEDVVFQTLNAFREQRLSVVQCLRQYVFCYEAILWHLAIELTRGKPGGVVIAPKPSLGRAVSLRDKSSVHGLSKGNAPITTADEEFSFFG
ncbi:hypothetical protein BGZ72_004458 [Mortierella alpina]|nr:hypothetical protein BGZ72_004458 [Mortierella alpina]